MQAPRGFTQRHTAWIGPALTGWCLGTALQLQQPALWTAQTYGLFIALALLSSAWLAIKRGALRGLVVMACAAACAFGACGLRGAFFTEKALSPALEGVDIRATGLVVAMPQRNDGGLRFRLAVASAVRAADGVAVALPPLLELHWYRGRIGFENALGETAEELQRAPADLRAGQRWQMTVRLKAPHGGRNPRGFDYELWLWEQGVQATGYVRAGPNDVAPQWLADTWRHPVERLRQSVRDAIDQRLAPPGAESEAARAQQRRAGVVAALVVGDQSAIDRADWDVFRATGVSHLVSISGVLVTIPGNERFRPPIEVEIRKGTVGVAVGQGDELIPILTRMSIRTSLTPTRWRNTREDLSDVVHDIDPWGCGPRIGTILVLESHRYFCSLIRDIGEYSEQKRAQGGEVFLVFFTGCPGCLLGSKYDLHTLAKNLSCLRIEFCNRDMAHGPRAHRMKLLVPEACRSHRMVFRLWNIGHTPKSSRTSPAQ